MKAVIAAMVALAAACAGTGAAAEEYPSKPVRLVVPGPAGGGTDGLARIVVDGVSPLLGQPLVIDNRNGASGMIAADNVLKSPADGYTLFIVFSAILTTNQWLYSKVQYDSQKDFVPVASWAQVPNVLVVNPDLPVKSVKELIALAKAQPGKLNYASSNPGSMSHLSMELLKQMAGIDMLHVPYSGDAPSIAALTGGHVSLMFSNTVATLPLIKAGRLRPLAIATSTRAPVLPDLPTVAEAGVPGYETTLWYGIMAKAGTPPAIVSKLNALVRKAQESPAVKARLDNVGAEPFRVTPQELSEQIRREGEKWGRVIKAANIKLN